MCEKAKIHKIDIPAEKRVLCISDIHGELALFKRLLDKVGFCDSDILILLGDIYTKGSNPHDTLRFCMEMHQKPNVHILRGNADWGNDEYLSEQENKWLDALPDIIEADKYIFVHSGLTSHNLEEQMPATVVKCNNFIETAPKFDKWVIVGHWPTAMYCHQIPCQNPIISEEKRIIAIDGGNVLKADGQLNAFIIENGNFSHVYVDALPTLTIAKTQNAAGGSIAITWLDRFVDIVEDGEELCRVMHHKSEKVITVPKAQVWKDSEGNTCICDLATDYCLACMVGDVVSVVADFPDRFFAKFEGTCGWVMK